MHKINLVELRGHEVIPVMLQKGVFVTTSNFLIPLVLQPNGGHLIFFLIFFDLLLVSSFQWSQYGLIKSEQLQIELNFVVTISFQQKMYSSFWET